MRPIFMEGPSLYLAQEQLRGFRRKPIREVSGNTKIEKERFLGKVVKDIFSWGKHLVFQFDTFGLRVHFLLFGTFTAEVDGIAVTGDYKKTQTPRLSFRFDNGVIDMYNCSVKIIEDKNIKKSYDFSIDIMSPAWDSAQALKRLQTDENEIADVLLDQEIFAGVGNIIKNEVLSLEYIHPKQIAKDIPKEKLRSLIEQTRAFSHQFYLWRKDFVLRKHLLIHRKGTCPHCGHKVVREKTGKRNRWSYYCPICQLLVPNT
jgi:endonuclease VIII